jgi:hypothetical protein
VDGPPDVSANLYTTRPDGTHLQQLTFAQDGVTQYLGSSYSPDGTMITFGRRPHHPTWVGCGPGSARSLRGNTTTEMPMSFCPGRT